MKLFNNLKTIFKFNHFSLKAKLLMLFIVISVVPILCTQSLSYYMSHYYLEKKINMLSNVNLFYMKTNIETDLNYYKDTLYRLAADNDCIDQETMFDEGNDFQKASSINKIRDIFGSYSYSRSQIRAITFVGKDGRNVYYDKKNQGIYNRIWDSYSDPVKAEIYSNILKSGVPVILATTANNYNGEKPEYMFHIGLRVRRIQSKEDIGILLMSFDEQELSDICNIERQNLNDNNINMFSLIIDKNGKVISSEDKKYIGTFIKEYTSNKINENSNMETLEQISSSIPKFTHKNVSINSSPLSGADWRIINVIDKDKLFYEDNLFRNLTVIASIVIIIIVMIVIVTSSNKFYNSVKIIANGMNEVKKGNFKVKIHLDTEDELAFISDEFNEMATKINSLVEDIKKQSDYICEISNQRRDAEIKAIVSQINPHFLYNTLDCINWMAIKKEQYEISDMLGYLAQILRYGIGNIDEQVSVYDEIEWLKKYIYLQKIRFNNSFVLKLDVNEGILGCRIHKLLLQPLVENSIIHGFKGYDAGGELIVTIKSYQDNYLIITVKDNGTGISEEKLNEILKYIYSSKNEGRNIGIKNVYDRIKIYYGEAARFDMESKEGKGTSITLILPL